MWALTGLQGHEYRAELKLGLELSPVALNLAQGTHKDNFRPIEINFRPGNPSEPTNPPVTNAWSYEGCLLWE